ncbi:MAG: DUF6472 family protein [Clostridia bacterium]|nr:DUF6472 family protein [Clostridia bacterium]
MSEDISFRTRYTPKIEREKNQLPSAKKRQICCEECEHYDYDDECDMYYCKMSLDEDEMVSFISGKKQSCPYYKYYDEYKSVRRQI